MKFRRGIAGVALALAACSPEAPPTPDGAPTSPAPVTTPGHDFSPAPEPDIKVEGCSTLGAYALNLPWGDRSESCKVAEQMRSAIEDRKPSTFLKAELPFKGLGFCILRPLFVQRAGTDYFGLAQLKGGLTEVTAFPSLEPIGNDIPRYESVLLLVSGQHYEAIVGNTILDVGLVTGIGDCQ